MRRKIVIYFLLFFCVRLFATPVTELYSKILEQKDRFWIPVECVTVLSSNDKQRIKDFYPDIEKLNFYDELEEKYIYWDEFECFSNFCIVPEYDFTNDALCITFEDSDSLSFYFSNISRSNEQNFYFYIIKTYNCKKLENRNSFSQWPIKEDECEMILKFDGDYLYVYLNDINNLYGIFCRVDDKAINEYNKLIRTGKCDLSKVKWPRHADGSCDYDGSKKAVTVQTAAEEPVFILKNDLVLEDMYLNEHSFSKGDKFLFDYTKKGFGVDLYNPLSIEIFFKDTNGTSYTSNIDDVCLEDYDFKIGENISKDYWIPSYYYDLLKSNTPFDDVLKYEKYWANFTFVAEDEPKWYDFFGIQRYYFGDFNIVVFGSDGYKDVDFFAYLEEVSDTKIVYNVQKMYSHYFDYKEEVSYNQPEFLPLFEKETPFKIILTLDGDYMKMYIDEVSEKNLFQTLIRTTPEASNQIENWIKGKSNDLSKVVKPKKLSVQNESSKATSSTNVAPNKTMTVSENLKLRSGEATSTQVLTVMQAGTKVKILELGKAETIDGISSNWVKVEVLSGAKDRDGRTIRAGTVGWCYGGYLAETTEANNFESTDTKEISDIKIEEAPKQEINIAIVCAIIGAVLLLLLLILIFAVRKKKDNL